MSYIGIPPRAVPNQDEHLPFLLGDNSDQVLRSLLPWLAKGFTPVFTSGTGLSCGFRAISQAFHAVREEIDKVQGYKGSRLTKLSVTTLRSWIDKTPGSPYRTMIDQLDTTKSILELENVEERDALYGELFEKNNISFDQIRMLVKLANNHFKTNFQLGVITVGYRGCFDSVTKEWDSGFIQDTTVTYLDNPYGNPTIWLLNSGTDGRSRRWNQPPQIPHWESFGLSGSQPIHKDLVRSWNLAAHIQDDVKNGVWMVNEAQDGGGNKLEVGAGAFVRMLPAGILPPAPVDQKLMVHADVNFPGEIPEALLEQVVLSHKAPQMLQQQTSTSTPGITTNTTPDTVKIDPTLFPLMKPLRFWRARSKNKAMDKAGNGINAPIIFNQSYMRDGFTYQPGEWLLNLDHETPKQVMWQRVRNISGEEGWATNVYLQDVRNAWGLPVTLKQHAGHQISYNWSERRIKQEAQKRGLLKDPLKNIDRDELFGEIAVWEFADKEQLRMMRVKRTLTSQEGIQFVEGEIVYLEEAADSNNSLVVATDYQGQEGRIDLEDLERIAGNPWGVNLAADSELDAQLAKILEKPDERDGFGGPAFKNNKPITRVPVRDRTKLAMSPESKIPAITESTSELTISTKKRPLDEDETEETGDVNSPSTSPALGPAKKKIKKTSPKTTPTKSLKKTKSVSKKKIKKTSPQTTPTKSIKKTKSVSKKKKK